MKSQLKMVSTKGRRRCVSDAKMSDNCRKTLAIRLIMDAISPIKELSLIKNSDLVDEAAELAVANKIFPTFYDGCQRFHIDFSPRVQKMAAEFGIKKRAQKAMIKELLKVSRKLELEFIVAKTLRPFNYVGDDVDLLVQDYKTLRFFVNALLSKGYMTKQVGTPEIIMRKKFLGTVVDVDIHHELAAGYIQYLRTEDLWSNRVKQTIDDDEVYVPSPRHELLITIGHSVLKELRMRIADWYHLQIASNLLQIDRLYEEATRQGLGSSMKTFVCAAEILCRHFFQKNVESYSETSYRGHGIRIDVPILRSILSSRLDMPYVFPIELVFRAYANKFEHEVKHNGIKSIIDFVKMPSAKGINLFVNYLIGVPK